MHDLRALLLGDVAANTAQDAVRNPAAGGFESSAASAASLGSFVAGSASFSGEARLGKGTSKIVVRAKGKGRRGAGPKGTGCKGTSAKGSQSAPAGGVPGGGGAGHCLGGGRLSLPAAARCRRAFLARGAADKSSKRLRPHSGGPGTGGRRPSPARRSRSPARRGTEHRPARRSRSLGRRGSRRSPARRSRSRARRHAGRGARRSRSFGRRASERGAARRAKSPGRSCK